jgi:hypothetical protein
LKKQGFKTDFAVVIGALKNKYDQLNPQTLFRDPSRISTPLKCITGSPSLEGRA